ncbi:MAG: hypothetical protein AB7V04_03045 [Desulfomonilaceae bacterium]
MKISFISNRYLRFKRKIFFFSLISLLLISLGSGECYLPVKDVGFILEIVDENIVVQGELGIHVLEIIGACSWCEVGAPVAVDFISSTRAELIQTEFSFFKKTIKAFIIRDGRGDEFNP